MKSCKCVDTAFRPGVYMGHVGCDTADMAFSPQGVIWDLAIFGLIRLLRYAVMICA